MPDQPLVNEEVKGAQGKTARIQGKGNVDEEIILSSEWRDKVLLDSPETSRRKRIGDLIWLAMGLGSIVVTMIAAGIGCGMWLEKWLGWSSVVVTALVTAGGLAILGWGIFRE